MRFKNLKKFAAMGLAMAMSFSLAAPAFAADEPTLMGYDLTLHADVPATVGFGTEIPLSLEIIGTRSDNSTTEEFYAFEGVQFTYDTNMFTFTGASNDDFTITVDEASGLVDIKTATPIGNTYTDDTMPAMKLTVRNDIDASTSGSLTLGSNTQIAITGYNPDDYLFGYMRFINYNGGRGFSADNPGKLVINPTDTSTVTFDLNNAEASSEDALTLTMVNGSKVTAAMLPDVTVNPAHYSFDGWFDAEGNAFAETTVNGDVTFTAKYTAQKIDIDRPVDPTPVDPGFTDEIPADGPHYKEDYTGKIDPYQPEVYDYTVTYTNPDTGVTEAVTVTVNADGTFVIPGKDVTENLDIVITATIKGQALTTTQYGAGVAMVRWNRAKAESGAFTFQGRAMTYVPEYSAYVILVACSKAEYDTWKATLTPADLLFVADGTTVEVSAASDVNNDGTVNLYDASYIANVFNGAPAMVAQVATDSVHANYLRADLNHDGVVNAVDYVSWVR